MAATSSSAEQQIEIVRQVANILYDYRDRPSSFTTFDVRCGMLFGRNPVSAIFKVTPSGKDEQFLCKDKDLLEEAGSEREAFYEAVDIFASHEVALAWNGKSPIPDFDVPREMSLGYAHPTMSANLRIRRKGEADEFALRMLFIAFESTLAATIYAGKRPGLLK